MILTTLSVLTANQLKGQSLFDGVLANSRVFFVFSAFYIFKAVYSERIIVEIERIFKISIWIFLFLYVIINLFYSRDDIQFTSLFSDATYALHPKVLFRNFLNIGSFYYFIRIVRQNRVSDLLFFALMFGIPNIVELQRGEVLFTIAVCSLLILLFPSQKVFAKIWFSLSSFIGILLLLYVTSTSFKAKTDEVGGYFENAFTVILQNETTTDTSSNGRIMQFLFVYNDLVNNLFLGNGRLRAGAKGDIIGARYFHPSDIGIIGAIYVFGIGVLFVYALYYLISLRLYRLGGKMGLSDFVMALNIFILFKTVMSLTNGHIVFNLDQTFCALAFVCAAVRIKQNES